MEWNDQKERQILKKSKWLLTQKMVLLLMRIGFLYLIYMLILTLVVETFGGKREDSYYSQVALSLKQPNVYGLLDIEDEKVTFLGTHHYSYNVMKLVGDNEIELENVQIAKPVIPFFSRITYSKGLERAFTTGGLFKLPEDPRTNKKLQGVAADYIPVWERLDKLPEGTVGELHFSTNSFMSPEQMLQLVADYDMSVLWMPLYTGEFLNFEPNHYGSGGSSISIGDSIGLAGGRSHGEDFRSYGFSHTLEQGLLEESKSMLLKNMTELLDKSKTYQENFLGLSHLQKRYDYLEREGFVVYGATVTGPVKELLKLQQLEEIAAVQLGDVALWNWTSKND